MRYTTLARTGLRVSRLGLGAGGHSRLGLSIGKTTDEAVGLIRRAMELGVNLIDTAESYETEEVVGAAVRGQRDGVILSTKKTIPREGAATTADDLVKGLEASLRRLGTDHVDIYHLHAVVLDGYAHAREELAPALMRLREQGKIRFIGVTEAFNADPGHAMLARAVADDCWDVMMLGFNVLNQSARRRVLEQTRDKGIGTLNMFAVRQALSRPEKLREVVSKLLEQGLVDPEQIDRDDPLGFLVDEAGVSAGAGGAGNVADAAYRFCRDEPGIDVVLSGTGNTRHLEQNVESMLRPPLPEEHRERLMRMFERVDNISGQ
jgi:L-galactose dehydrogenase